MIGKPALDQLYKEAETLRKEWEKNEKEKIPGTEFYGITYPVSHRLLGYLLQSSIQLAR